MLDGQRDIGAVNVESMRLKLLLAPKQHGDDAIGQENSRDAAPVFCLEFDRKTLLRFHLDGAFVIRCC